MSSAYLRAIRGPVLLIVFGVLMLADHRTDLSFSRTWPLLLVAGGALVLAERAAVRENPWTASTAPAAVPPPIPPSTIAYRPFGQPDSGAAEDQPKGGPQA